jgi:hypothetical protein
VFGVGELGIDVTIATVIPPNVKLVVLTLVALTVVTFAVIALTFPPAVTLPLVVISPDALIVLAPIAPA